MHLKNLIELAATASGVEIDQQLDDGTILIDIGHGGTNSWNPMDSEKDKRWLAEKLGLDANLLPLEIVTAAASLTHNRELTGRATPPTE